MKDVEIDVRLLGRVLLGMGLKWRTPLHGRGYDLRTARRDNAGGWLQDALSLFEERTGHRPEFFSISGQDLLILA
jgi:hypothetical protein